MTGRIRPLPHPDPFVDATRGYITSAVAALQARGVPLSESWLDPSSPRDATLLLGSQALVWNESEGWVLGEYRSGAPGVRTVLGDPVRLGDGVLPDPEALAALVLDGATGEPPSRLRPFTAGHDGFEDGLARYPLA